MKAAKFSIRVIALQGNRVKLGIEAPAYVPIVRTELIAVTSRLPISVHPQTDKFANVTRRQKNWSIVKFRLRLRSVKNQRDAERIMGRITSSSPLSAEVVRLKHHAPATGGRVGLKTRGGRLTRTLSEPSARLSQRESEEGRLLTDRAT